MFNFLNWRNEPYLKENQNYVPTDFAWPCGTNDSSLRKSRNWMFCLLISKMWLLFFDFFLKMQNMFSGIWIMRDIFSKFPREEIYLPKLSNIRDIQNENWKFQSGLKPKYWVFMKIERNCCWPWPKYRLNKLH